MNSVIKHSKDRSEGNNNEKGCSNGSSRCKITGRAVNLRRGATKEMGARQQQAKKGSPVGGSLFVKVNMDGMPIGRKVDLSSHHTYEALATALEEMFQSPSSVDRSNSWGPPRRALSSPFCPHFLINLVSDARDREELESAGRLLWFRPHL